MRFAPHKSYARQQGLSLIEVMIALLIGIILMGGAVSIFISNNATANLVAQLSRMQDNSRLLIDVLSRNIRMAGYSGCTSRGNVAPNVVANSSPLLLPFSDNSSVRGYDALGGGSWAPALPTNVELATAATTLSGISRAEDADILVVRHVDECVAHVAQLASTTSTINISTIIVHPFPRSCNISPTPTEPLPLIISDCNATDVFQSDSITLIPGNRQEITYDPSQNRSATLSANYDTDATVSVPFFSIFYIGENGDPNVREPLSLYMLRWEPSGSDIYKLADGVQDMQIFYASGTPYADTYVPANAVAVTDWPQIRSVRIELLLQSTDNTTSEPQPYTFPSTTTTTTTTPGDKRLRFAFSTTISLRNRLP